MSLAAFPLAEPAIAQVQISGSSGKAPPKRRTLAKADAPLAPEPR